MALNPMKPGEAHLMDDTDLAGPLLFCLAYGGFLLLVCVRVCLCVCVFM